MPMLRVFYKHGYDFKVECNLQLSEGDKQAANTWPPPPENKIQSWGNSLHLAAIHGHMTIIKFLCKEGGMKDLINKRA
jgi:hypothetical protein